MDIWSTLGIEKTTDEEGIRKAFSEGTKQCHPEESPEEFNSLRTAYKRALKYAKTAKESRKEPQDPHIQSESRTEEVPNEENYDFSEIIHNRMDDRTYEEFFWEFDSYNQDEFVRSRVETWMYLMEQQKYSKIITTSNFKYQLTRKLLSLPYLTQPVWHYFIRQLENGIEDSIRHTVVDSLEEQRKKQESMQKEKKIKPNAVILQRMTREYGQKRLAKMGEIEYYTCYARQYRIYRNAIMLHEGEDREKSKREGIINRKQKQMQESTTKDNSERTAIIAVIVVLAILLRGCMDTSPTPKNVPTNNWQDRTMWMPTITPSVSPEFIP